MCTRYPIINRVSELKVHIELTRFVQPEKIEIDANERAVNEKSQYCFFVCTTFDSFLNDFLGFTFYCSKTRKGGFVPKVQTSRKKLEQKVRAYKNWIYDNRNRPMREIIKELNVKLIGHYRYYGVTWNFRKITTFLHRVQQFLFKAMNRRGCRRAYTWNGFVEMLKYYPLAKPKTYYCLY